MPLIRIEPKQGHAIPKGYQNPLGPFPPEIFARNPRAYDSFNQPEAMPEELVDVRMFRCKDCGDILLEHHLESHECELEDN